MFDSIAGRFGLKSIDKKESFFEQEKKDLIKELLGSYIKMYEISGHDTITEENLDKYIKNKKEDNIIREQVEKTPDSFRKKIKGAPMEKRFELIKRGLSSPSMEIKDAAISAIRRLWGKGYARQIKILQNISVEIIKRGLSDPNIKIQEAAAGMVPHLEETEQKKSLMNMVADNIEKGLHNPDIETQKIATTMIENAPKEKIPHLIKLCLDNTNIKIQEAAAGMVPHLEETEQKKFLMNMVADNIEKGLRKPDIETQKIAIKMIKSAPKGKIPYLIKLCLNNNPNIEIRRMVTKIILYVPKEEVSYFIKLYLKNPDIDIKIMVSSMSLGIESCPIQEKEFLKNMIVEDIKKGLESSDIEVQKARVAMIGSLIGEKKKQLTDLVISIGSNELIKELIRPSLYISKDIDKKEFSRKNFEKTGSTTTLFGGKLKDKTIVRHIGPEEFLLWQKAYEDYNGWRDAGFDYVPIEPIQSYRLNKKNGLVDVFCGVLDINMENWIRKSDLFGRELEEKKNKIVELLNKLGIDHRNTIESNFCLRFFRDKDDNIDLSKVPRIYLIDFDQPVSIKM